MRTPFQVSMLALILLSCQACQPGEDSNIVNIENDLLAVGISTTGAELQSIFHKESEIEYLWQGDPEYWDARAPVMFPVNVRFKEDRFTYRGIPYEMPTLGVAVKSSFNASSNNQRDKAVFNFSSNEETLINYPFSFNLEISFSLDGNRLKQEFIVKNTGKDSMYFVLGGHPGFRFPYPGGKTRNDYCLIFPDTLNISRQEVSGGLVQPSSVPFLENESRLALGDSRIPNSGMLLLNLPVRQIGIGLLEEPPYISVDLGDFPNVNIWTPPGKPYVCIEPMIGHHDLENSPLAIEEKSYLVALKPGATRAYSFTIIVH